MAVETASYMPNDAWYKVVQMRCQGRLGRRGRVVSRSEVQASTQTPENAEYVRLDSESHGLGHPHLGRDQPARMDIFPSEAVSRQQVEKGVGPSPRCQ